MGQCYAHQRTAAVMTMTGCLRASSHVMWALGSRGYRGRGCGPWRQTWLWRLPAKLNSLTCLCVGPGLLSTSASLPDESHVRLDWVVQIGLCSLLQYVAGCS